MTSEFIHLNSTAERLLNILNTAIYTNINVEVNNDSFQQDDTRGHRSVAREFFRKGYFTGKWCQVVWFRPFGLLPVWLCEVADLVERDPNFVSHAPLSIYNTMCVKKSSKDNSFNKTKQCPVIEWYILTSNHKDCFLCVIEKYYVSFLLFRRVNVMHVPERV